MIDILHVEIPLSEECPAFGIDLITVSRQNHPWPMRRYDFARASEHGHFATFDIDFEKCGWGQGAGFHEFVNTRNLDGLVT